jgi:3-isopropylmalate/(R)-2-methylmalate dehydratase small subunit
MHRVWRVGATSTPMRWRRATGCSTASTSSRSIAWKRCGRSSLPAFAPATCSWPGPTSASAPRASRPPAPCVHLGIAAVIAPSYAGLFFRNAFNLGLLLLTCPAASASQKANASPSTPAPAPSPASGGECCRRTHSRLPARHGRGRRPASATATPLPGKDDPVTFSLYDLLIKNVRVVRPHGNVVHEGDIAIRDGKFAKVAPGIDGAPGEAGARRRRPARLPRRGRRAHAQRHLFAAGGGRAHRVEGGGHGRRHLQPELLPHRPVLPEQGRPVRAVLPRGAGDQPRPLPRRLRLPPGADGQHAHRRDPDADREARRLQLQDLHVLRLARPARRQRIRSASS